MSNSDDKRSVKKADDENENDASTRPNKGDEAEETLPPNPPRTTIGGWFTAPKFGSAGSGGAELEPGPERD
ncbi:MAG TPA: hypothetical protein VK636_00060 [Gemmatimonadaceae bacterium]|nr:hypothetical protein [Gemmatimonadaceae bacterium]